MSDILKYAIIILGVAVLYLFHALSTYALMQFRFRKRIVTLCWGGYVVVSTALSVTYMLFIPELATPFGFFSALFLYIVLCFILTDYSYPKQCFITANYIICYIILHSIGTVLAKNTSEPYLVAVAIRTGLYLLMLPLFWHYLRPAVTGLRFPHEREWRPLAAAAAVIAAVLILRTMLLNTDEFYNSNQSLWSLLSIVAMLAAVYWVMFRSIGYIEKLSYVERDALRAKLYEVQLASMREAEDEARRVRHDMRHHDLVILEYLNAGNVEGVRHYLGDGKGAFSQSPYHRWCENDTVNSIITAYSKKSDYIQREADR